MLPSLILMATAAMSGASGASVFREKRTLGLSNDTIAKVKANAIAITNQSWEYGTLAEALTELEYPSLSVFARTPVDPTSLGYWSEYATDVIAIANATLNNKTTTYPDDLPLIEGAGAVGDPASLGNAVLLANWTAGNGSDSRYAVAAAEQLYYLLDIAPRGNDGVISQRNDSVQLWADAVYMFPPFLAYYGALQSNISLLYEAYNQVSLYRETLLDPNGTGLWRHIELGTWSDNSLWGTGNGWAAAGMARVLQTLADSDYASDLSCEIDDIEEWLGDLLDACWEYQGTNGTLYNIVNGNDNSTFGDTSTTALIASATYRLASYNGDSSRIKYADKAYQLIVDSIDENGWLLNAVDPLVWTALETPGIWSPEGQSFVLLVHAAWRDYYSLL